MVDVKCIKCSFTNKLEFKERLVGKSVLFNCKNPTCKEQIKFTFPELESNTESYQTIITDYNLTAPSAAKIKWHNKEENQQLDFKLSEGVNILGRKSSSKFPTIAIPCNDMSMSRMHCVIVQSSYDTATSFLLKEYDNKNKLILNGKALERGTEIYLEEGDKVTLGSTQIIFNKI